MLEVLHQTAVMEPTMLDRVVTIQPTLRVQRLSEANELVAILSASIKTARSKTD